MAHELITCDHRCRNTCAMLQQSLQKETEQVTFFETLLKECTEPEVRKFAEEFLGVHRDLARRITDQLNVIRTKAQTLDAIIASYES